MFRKISLVSVFLVATFTLGVPALSPAKRGNKAPDQPGKTTAQSGAILWQQPEDIATRDLFYGPGGKQDAPTSTVTFLKEDMNGSNPKFDVRDENGVKWKVKLGEEARPETAASRLVWSVGYFTSEDYFLRELRVKGMPAHLSRKRVRKIDFSNGILRNVRLKRDVSGEKKIGSWHWRDNPFTDKREFNGLRVLMALINNWDVTDVNTAVYEPKDGDGPKIYLISDLGATFGTTGRGWPNRKSKGNIDSYRRAKFIRKITPEYIDFNVPTRPALITVISFREFFSRLHLRWIGKHIPRSDAKWMGQILAQLSSKQVRDAFRAGGYSPEEANEFASVLERRIGELNEL